MALSIALSYRSNKFFLPPLFITFPILPILPVALGKTLLRFSQDSNQNLTHWRANALTTQPPHPVVKDYSFYFTQPILFRGILK